MAQIQLQKQLTTPSPILARRSEPSGFSRSGTLSTQPVLLLVFRWLRTSGVCRDAVCCTLLQLALRDAAPTCPTRMVHRERGSQALPRAQPSICQSRAKGAFYSHLAQRFSGLQQLQQAAISDANAGV